MTSNAPAVWLRDVAITFGPRAALHGRPGIELAVAAGEFVAVVGPTGCGKSTLLNAAAGLLPPSAGRVDLRRRSRASTRGPATSSSRTR